MLVEQIHKLLDENAIYHKIERNYVVTKRSRTRIPDINGDVAYLIGVLTGDGSLSMVRRKRGGDHHIVRIYAGSEDWLRHLGDLFYELFGCRGQIIRDNRKQSTFYLLIQNAAIFWYFATVGVPRGRKGEFLVPSSVKKDKNLFLMYLLGFVDTDGHVCGNRVQLKQKSKQVMSDIFNILSNLDMNVNPPKINYTNGKPYYYIRFDNKLPTPP